LSDDPDKYYKAIVGEFFSLLLRRHSAPRCFDNRSDDDTDPHGGDPQNSRTAKGCHVEACDGVVKTLDEEYKSELEFSEKLMKAVGKALGEALRRDAEEPREEERGVEAEGEWKVEHNSDKMVVLTSNPPVVDGITELGMGIVRERHVAPESTNILGTESRSDHAWAIFGRRSVPATPLKVADTTAASADSEPPRKKAEVLQRHHSPVEGPPIEACLVLHPRESARSRVALPLPPRSPSRARPLSLTNKASLLMQMPPESDTYRAVADRFKRRQEKSARQVISRMKSGLSVASYPLWS
jgi:hypothetical protein